MIPKHGCDILSSMGAEGGVYGGREGYEGASVAKTGEMFGVKKHTNIHMHTGQHTVKQQMCMFRGDKFSV